MVYTHAEWEAEKGYTLSATTEPSDAEVDAICTKAAALLTARVGTVTYTNADEEHVLNLIVDQFLAKKAFAKNGFVNSSTYPDGTRSIQSIPVTWTQEIIDEVWIVYGVDISVQSVNTGSPWTHVSED